MSCSMMKFSMSGKKRSARKSPKKIKSPKSPKRSKPKRSKSQKRSKPKRSKSPKKSKSPKRSKSPKKSKARTGLKKADTRGCSLQHTKKYSERPSPAYPANQCCGHVMVGNDGNTWQSRPDSNGVCHWYKL